MLALAYLYIFISFPSDAKPTAFHSSQCRCTTCNKRHKHLKTLSWLSSSGDESSALPLFPTLGAAADLLHAVCKQVKVTKSLDPVSQQKTDPHDFTGVVTQNHDATACSSPIKPVRQNVLAALGADHVKKTWAAKSESKPP